jgi:hypothetical protein
MPFYSVEHLSAIEGPKRRDVRGRFVGVFNREGIAHPRSVDVDYSV